MARAGASGRPRPTGVAPPTGNGRPHGAAPTAFHRGRFVGAGPRPARQVWGTSRDTAGGAHPRVASLGLRPIHLQPLPYVFYRNGSISLVGETLGPPAGTCLPKRRAGEGTRPYGGSKRRAESSRPTGFNSGKLAQQTQAQFLNRTSGKFFPTQGPCGPGLKRRQALLVLRAGNFASLTEGHPRMRGPG